MKALEYFGLLVSGVALLSLVFGLVSGHPAIAASGFLFIFLGLVIYGFGVFYERQQEGRPQG